ncbi:hypothetical protein [Chiayiivirga flava]|uniref:hypothetical protein n=1 Tax=Chiayiivirga flava TaxID=659595 RepID=UPI00160D037D|nr:hypothetical protein [Chiayiivirga flava]
MSWGGVIVLGMLVTTLAQLLACVAAFRHSAASGLLALLVPGYLFLALNRSGAYWPIVGSWLAGVLAVVAGTIALA